MESVLAIAKLYNKLPSEIIGIDDEYTAYCFNEACACIVLHLTNGEKPNYEQIERENKVKNKEYSSFIDFYKDFGG